MTAGFSSLVRRSGMTGLAITIALAGGVMAVPGASAEEAGCSAPVTGQEELINLPDGVRAMTAPELHALYANKSWKWCDGAGYKQDERRVFKGWSGSGDSATSALGRWTVTDSGRMCLKATWHAGSGRYDADTCFRHMTDEHTIYQRKEPDGTWYVFRHADPLDSDEFSKLVAGDLVSETLETLRN